MSEIRIQVAEEVDRYLESAVKMGLFTNKAEIARAAIVQYMGTIMQMSKGYDNEVMFSPEGRLYQLEYARCATSRGLTTIGIACSNGVVIASETALASSPEHQEGTVALMLPLEKVVRVGESVLAGSSGLVMDGHLVMDSLRKAKFHTDAELLASIREVYKPYLYSRDVRPLGIGLVMGSVLDGAHLYQVDPSGSIMEFRATAIGRGKDDAQKVLSAKFKPMTVEEGEKLAREILAGRAAQVISLECPKKGKKS
jgi:proteasome alpha subunit